MGKRRKPKGLRNRITLLISKSGINTTALSKEKKG